MSELLEVYDLRDRLVGVKDRNKYYREIRKEFDRKKKISIQVKSIRLILMNSDGRIYLQKRSKSKKENSGLYDKTVGGHVPKGYTWELTVTKECAEELGFPAVVEQQAEFKIAKNSIDLGVVGLFQEVGKISPFLSERKTAGGGPLSSRLLRDFISAITTAPFNSRTWNRQAWRPIP